jgi:RHS repeat-associated protein
LIQYGDGSITVVRGTTKSLWFDLSGDSYIGRYGAKSTLTHDVTNQAFILAAPTGEQWTFQDFDQTTYPQGLFQSYIAPGGQTTQVTSYTAGAQIGEIQRSTTVDSVTTTQSFLYAYNADGQASSLTFRNQVDGGAWNQIRNVVYAYYAAGDSNGSPGDLMQVTIQVPQDGDWTDVQIYYYRYYSSGDANGFIHGLKYVVKPNTYATIVADGYDPLSIADSVLAQYADQYLQYDSDHRVTLETLDGGSRTYTFAFTPSANSDDYNNWAMKTVETRPDGSQNVVYTNYIGQILLKELISGADSWINYYQFDSAAHRTLAANPSAVVGYDDTSANLSVTLNVSSGLIKVTDYYTTTGSGAAAGYVMQEALQQGISGTPVVLSDYAYTSQSAGGSTVYPISSLTIYRNDDGTGAVVTNYDYTWYSGTTQIQQKTTTLPAISTSQNGSGNSATTLAYYDALGNETWSMNERGFITAFVYDVPTGALAQRIDDVNTSVTTGAPSGWTTPTGGGLNLITDYQFDDLGRQTQALGPWHTIDLSGTATSVRRAAWTIYQDATYQVWMGQGYATGTAPDYTYTLINPVAITINDPSGRTLEMIQATRSSASGPLLATDSFPQSSYVRWTTYQYTDCCLVASQRVYHTIPSSGTGSPGINYDEIAFGYDSMKRQNQSTTPGGTITFGVFDARDNVIAIYVGTNDTGATETDPTGGGAAGNNMLIVTEFQFDDGGSSGDNNLTQETQYVDTTTTRLTNYLYDWRNRRTDIDGEVDFYQQVIYDNLDRVIQTDGYDTTASGNLIARSQTQYDDRGRVYQAITYGVDPSTGTVGNALINNNWYDPTGNILENLPAGSNLFTKSVYDGIGRLSVQYAGYATEETSYSDAGSVTNDVILEQSETIYDDASTVLQTTRRQRYHNAAASQLGQLGNPSTDPCARVVYQAQWADPLGRTVAVADFGTNGGLALSRPSTIPTGSAIILVASTSYDTAGNLQSKTDPIGMVTLFEYDDAGRQTTIVENYQPSTSSSSSSGCAPSDDMNRTTSFTYTPDGAQATLVAQNSRTSNQTTTYAHGTTLSNSELATSTLLLSMTYPDSLGGNDVVTFSYNRQGQRVTTTDQRGNVHAYDYDGLGRLLNDRVTTLGTGVDGSVLRLGVTYEVRGLLDTLTSYDNATVGSGAAVNEVQQAYNNFAQLISSAQDHGGVVSASSPSVGLSYANGSTNTIRPSGIIYPNGRTLSYSYGTLGGISDQISRLSSIVDNNGEGTALANYDFLGLGVVVVIDHTEPEMEYTLVDLLGNSDPDTGDIYTGLDRFSRVKNCRWYNYGTSADVVRLQYGYDSASNRLWRADSVAQSAGHGFDELYSYDGLRRLQTMQRGILNGSQTAITSQIFGQCWDLDSTGNWTGMMEADGGSIWTLQQSRTANSVNEITGISNAVGSAWAQPTYDLAGNMATIPQSADPTQSFTATYDAWNRLKNLVDSATSYTVQENQYDARSFRVVRMDYNGGSLSEIRHFYYSPDWRCIEERIGSSTTPDSHFVWGLWYIDSLVLRDRDTTGNGTLDERLYACQDANSNVVAVTDPNGVVQERYAYSQYGLPLFLSNSFEILSSSNFGLEILYCAYRFDATTLLYNVRHRIYIPLLGGWGQRDPIDFVAGLSLYEYCHSQPNIMVDALGLICQELARTPLVKTWIATGAQIGFLFAQLEVYIGGTIAGKVCTNCCPDGRKVVDQGFTASISATATVAGGVGLNIDYSLFGGRVFGYVGVKLSGSASASISVSGITNKCAGINNPQFKGCVDVTTVLRLSGGGSVWFSIGLWNYDVAAEVFGQWSGTLFQLCYDCSVAGGCQFTTQRFFSDGSFNAGIRVCWGACYTVTLY